MQKMGRKILERHIAVWDITPFMVTDHNIWFFCDMC